MNKNKIQTILITGASGFIGSAISEYFYNKNYKIIEVKRGETGENVISKDISGSTDWSDSLKGIDIIIHCAAAVHQMKESDHNIESYQKVNVAGTLNLANQAKNHVKRFIFLSTIKVNGEETFAMKFTPEEEVNPKDPYSISKKIAEDGLIEISKSSEMEVVIIRPPLVYGKNPKGNLGKLSNLINMRLPLPFGLITTNKRSLIYIENLIEFINICTFHPKAANEKFLISDGEDISTKEMILLIAKAMNKKAYLVPIPSSLLRLFFVLIGKKEYGNRLMGSLSIDISKSKDRLGWDPKFSISEGFKNSFKD
tara:strand:- start:676 stop:1608 length:933 start_codon:yes stop_codon:yes gene_type:complete